MAAGPRRTDAAELAGMLDAAGTTDVAGVTFRTSSPAVARSAVRLWRSAFGVEPRLSPAETDRFKRTRYAVRAEGERAEHAGEKLAAARDAKGSADGAAYLRGAFAAAGYVTRPGAKGGHHLELVHRDEGFARRIAALSRAPMRVVRRRGAWVAYAKGADGVTTVLSQMGLHDAVLEYEARAVLGEAKAHANRLTNFDSANAGRTALAAARQQEALERLDPRALPAALREMLELRLEHPDASLADLARLGNITKSAANHRLRRLVEMAERRRPGSPSGEARPA